MSLGIKSRSFRRSLPGRATLIDGSPVVQTPGKVWYVGGDNASRGGTPDSWTVAESRLQQVIDKHVESGRGDVIYVGPTAADTAFDEAVTVNKSNLTIIGVGSRGSIFFAPSAADATAFLIDGTAGRVADVGIHNIGCETNGTGIAMHLKGDVRRIRAYESKIEGGDTALKLESTADGAPADNQFRDIELAFSGNAMHLTASGGGDPVTQTYLYKSLLHDYDRGIFSDVAHVTGLWIVKNVFARNENGTDPTNEFLKLDVASSEGLIAGNRFATTIFSTAKFAIAAEIRFVGNYAEAEGPATGGGTSGRPD